MSMKNLVRVAAQYIGNDVRRRNKFAMRLFLLFASMLFIQCRSNPNDPAEDFAVHLSGEVHWSSSEVVLTSAGFRDTQSSNEAPEVQFFIGNDTLNHVSLNDTTRSAQLPDLLTGEYTITGTIRGIAFEPIPMEIRGVHSDPYRLVFRDGERWTVHVWSFNRVIGFGNGAILTYGGFAPAVYVFDLHDGTHRTLGELGQYPQMISPGPSQFSDRIVVESNGRPVVWDLTGSPTMEGELGCFSNRLYEVAHLQGNKCLGLWDRSIWSDTTTRLTAPQRDLNEASFRTTANGNWTVPVTRFPGIPPQLDEWYIFNSSPSIQARVTRYRHVPGAAFSPAGDTLFLVADIGPSDGTSTFRRWVLDAVNPIDGTVYRSENFPVRSGSLPGVIELLDVLVDPVSNRIFVARLYWTGTRNMLALGVLDRGDFSSIANLQWVTTFGTEGGGYDDPSFMIEGRLFQDGAGEVVFLVGRAGEGGSTAVWQFDLLP